MIELKDLERFYTEASNLDFEETFDAWEIDKDAFADFITNIARAGLEDMVKRGNPTISVSTIFLIGFEMGYKMSLEAELKRAANEPI